MFFCLIATDLPPRILQTQAYRAPLHERVKDILTQNNTHSWPEDICIEPMGREIWITFNSSKIREEQMSEFLAPLFSLLNKSPNDFLVLRNHAVSNLQKDSAYASYPFLVANIEGALKTLPSQR